MENKEYFTIINKNQLDHYRPMVRNLRMVENDPVFYVSNWVVFYYECHYEYHNNIMRYKGFDYLEQADLVNKAIISNEEDFNLLANGEAILDTLYVFENDVEDIKESPKDYMFSFNDDIDLKSSKTASSKTKPSYYKGEYDLISHLYDIMTHEELRGFLKGNVIKYIDRYQDKNGIEDLNKAREYSGRLIEFEKKLKGEDNKFIQ